MPISIDLQNRIIPILPQIIEEFGTPFFIYDEKGIVETSLNLKNAFKGLPSGFKEFFAVKANPNPKILAIMREMGFGFDCSSVTELKLARQAGAKPKDIMFTSNDTSQEEFAAALQEGGCILNLDDIGMVDKIDHFPGGLACFRYNPGPRRTGNSIIGNPAEAKYGVPHEQIINAYREARKKGATRFGIHTMICSNELSYQYMVTTVKMLLDVVEMIETELNIKFEFINMGGGLGIPYKPEQSPLPLKQMAQEIKELLIEFKKIHGYTPKLLMESGRYITGPHGIFVTKCINQKHGYKEYRGVDSCCTSSVVRPAMYWSKDHPDDGWHYISILKKNCRPKNRSLTEIVNIVGATCENNDYFCHDRKLPKIIESDIIIVHDVGAHAPAMGNNYNGRLRPQELLLRLDGSIELIRRAQTFDDYVKQFYDFESKILKF